MRRFSCGTLVPEDQGGGMAVFAQSEQDQIEAEFLGSNKNSSIGV